MPLDNKQVIFTIAEDITERKETEERLLTVLGEKDFLLKELNHRVKNNLLMVNSLISLKETSLQGAVDLSDISRQIDAIRIVHEKLNQTEDIARLNAAEYIHDLLLSIFSFSNKQIKIDETIESETVSTKLAVTLGLIINEIATNALKHGFPETEEGNFTVTFTEDPLANQYTLTLSNTGRPFPGEIDLDNPETLGMRLISALVGQLEGSIDLKREPHPVFTIRFPAV